VAYWSGDMRDARADFREAMRISPIDPDLRASEERVFLGQARLGQRVQRFPAGYDDVYTTDATVSQRSKRLRFEGGVTVVSRYGAERDTRSGRQKTQILDGRPSFGAYYHHREGAWFGGSVAVSAPALALPRYAFEVKGFAPWGTVLSLHAACALWRYEDDRDVLILSPAVTVALTDSLDVTARYWLTSVIIRANDKAETVNAVHSVGARIAFRPGVQLERNPLATELLELRSHIVTLLGQRMLSASFGVDASLAVERRASASRDGSVVGGASELGAFVRW
jgi:hypothetical protein